MVHAKQPFLCGLMGFLSIFIIPLLRAVLCFFQEFLGFFTIFSSVALPDISSAVFPTSQLLIRANPCAVMVFTFFP
jgi:hypothetical protein